MRRSVPRLAAVLTVVLAGAAAPARGGGPSDAVFLVQVVEHQNGVYVPIPVWAGPSDTSATPGASTTCYDNSNTAGTTQQYSLKQNGGNGVNCALSFRFQ